MKPLDTSDHNHEFDQAAARRAISARLDVLLPADASGPATLIAAARATLLAPAKHVRAVLTLMIADAWDGPHAGALDLACAVEMVHAASLIIDDLPCMDDATTRRGAPASHLSHGESTSILAAFALMAQAFDVIAKSPHLSDRQRTEATAALAAAIGPLGLTGGQQDDLHATPATIDEIERIHAAKTGALFLAAAEFGSIAANMASARRILMTDFCTFMGLAFQAFDDLIDVAGSVESAGKDIDQDAERPNLSRLIGFEAARERADRHVATAHDCLKASGARTEALAGFLFETAAALRAKSADRRHRAGPEGA